MRILVRETNDNKCSYVWKEISKTRPFSGRSYTTVDGRSYDAIEIIKISHDYRLLGYVQCSGCGEIIKASKLEKHYADREANANCAKCSSLVLRKTNDKKKVTLLPNGQAICKTINDVYCSARSVYNSEPVSNENKTTICKYFQCRKSTTIDLPTDFLSAHPNPYKKILTEKAIIDQGWEFEYQGREGRRYSTRNGKLGADFDINGILIRFMVSFRNDMYTFLYSDVYDEFMSYNGRVFDWGDMAERTSNGYKRIIRNLYN